MPCARSSDVAVLLVEGKLDEAAAEALRPWANKVAQQLVDSIPDIHQFTLNSVYAVVADLLQRKNPTDTEITFVSVKHCNPLKVLLKQIVLTYAKARIEKEASQKSGETDDPEEVQAQPECPSQENGDEGADIHQKKRRAEEVQISPEHSSLRKRPRDQQRLEAGEFSDTRGERRPAKAKKQIRNRKASDDAGTGKSVEDVIEVEEEYDNEEEERHRRSKRHSKKREEGLAHKEEPKKQSHQKKSNVDPEDAKVKKLRLLVKELKFAPVIYRDLPTDSTASYVSSLKRRLVDLCQEKGVLSEDRLPNRSEISTYIKRRNREADLEGLDFSLVVNEPRRRRATAMSAMRRLQDPPPDPSGSSEEEEEDSATSSSSNAEDEFSGSSESESED